MDEQSVPRILIARLSAIGDVLHSLPVACALRKTFPTAKIGWVVEGRAGDLLMGHPAIDQLVRVPRKWLKSPRAIWELRRTLCQQRYDLSIDVQGLTKSAIAARLSGAPRRIGFQGCDGRECSTWLNNELVLPKQEHVIDRNLELLKPLGIERPQVEFRLPELASTATTVSEWLSELQLSASKFAVLNPGAGWPSKLWPVERFAAVARHLVDVYGLPSLVVWAGAAERAMAETIVAESAGQAKLAPASSLVELAGILRRARLMIAADTGPLHLAVAVGTPCVGLFGPMPKERNGPYGAEHIALQAARMSGSSRERRQATNETMQAIEVRMVTGACEVILARPTRHEPMVRVA
jgi:lipopolysaccharide heptosyltransferase I